MTPKTPPIIVLTHRGPVYWIEGEKKGRTYSSFCGVCSVDLEWRDKKQVGSLGKQEILSSLFVFISWTRGPFPMNQSDLECPWYILSAVKVACWSESISWTTLEGARRCFGHQKVKVNHLVYGGNFRVGDRKLTWCDTGKGGSSMEFREVRNSKKSVKVVCFFGEKKQRKKKK